MLTRQDCTDKLLERGLDHPSLLALLEAFEAVGKTGFGTVTLNFSQGQINLWRVEVTGKPVRK
jgi:hypothetical protein